VAVRDCLEPERLPTRFVVVIEHPHDQPQARLAPYGLQALDDV